MIALVTAVAVYIGIFIYLELSTVPKYMEYRPFTEELTMDEVPEPEKLEIDKEHVDFIQNNANRDIKNTVKDMNDTRQASRDDWSSPSKQSGFDGEKAALDAQRKFQEEARNSSYNQEVKKIIEERSKQMQNVKEGKKNTSTNPSQNNSNTGSKYDGQTLVSYDLKGRYPFQNNDWHIRNPGYTCGYGANGLVVISIKVNQNGNVIQAEYNASASKNADQCMIQQALKYAKLSRFDYNSSSPELQSGRIAYSFVSQ